MLSWGAHGIRVWTPSASAYGVPIRSQRLRASLPQLFESRRGESRLLYRATYSALIGVC